MQKPVVTLPRRVKRALIGGAGAAALVGLAAAAATAGLPPAGTITYVDLPAVTVPLPPAAGAQPGSPAAPAPSTVARLAAPEPDRGSGPPTTIDPALQDVTPWGAVPRIAPDGWTPLTHYARPDAGDCRRPCVAAIVTGLGLAGKLTLRALALPGPVGLAFSPYAGPSAWQGRARAAGHEALLALPLQPERFPEDDSGPLTILATAAPEQRLEMLLRVLATGSGYVAVIAEAGAFATKPEAFAPLAQALAVRGIGLVEIGGAALAGQAQAGAIDVDPAPAAIDQALAALAAEALRSGRALAVAQPLPASFERLTAWLASLPAQGIALVPPSRLLEPPAASALARP